MLRNDVWAAVIVMSSNVLFPNHIHDTPIFFLSSLLVNSGSFSSIRLNNVGNPLSLLSSETLPLHAHYLGCFPVRTSFTYQARIFSSIVSVSMRQGFHFPGGDWTSRTLIDSSFFLIVSSPPSFFASQFHLQDSFTRHFVPQPIIVDVKV